MTLPSSIACGLCPAISADEKAKHNGIRYQGIICASVLLKNPLAGYYVTNLIDSWVPFTAVIEMSALVDRDQFGGDCLVYLPKYVDPNDPMFEESDEQIRETFISALEKMYPAFKRSDVVAFQVSRVRRVLAISTLNYSDHLPSMANGCAGCLHHQLRAYQTTGTLNVNETIQLANTARQTIAKISCGRHYNFCRGASCMKTHRQPQPGSGQQVVVHEKPMAMWVGDAYPSYFDLLVPRCVKVAEEARDDNHIFLSWGRTRFLEQNHAVLASLSAAGHEIGNHSFKHEPWLHLYTDEEIETELRSAQEAIEKVTGYRPTGFRGPGI